MLTLPIQTLDGRQVGTYEFDPAELAKGVNKQLLHDVVVMYETNRRVGTARSKSRGEVAGSTKKLFKQKGTGRARMGTKRTPIRRGGGHTFNRMPKDWTYRLPRKAVRLATRMALLSKFQDGEVVLVEKLAVSEPKTKLVAAALKTLGLATKSCLLATDALDLPFYRSARNIPTVRISAVDDLNAYDLLHQKQLVLTPAGLDRLRNKAKA